MTSNNSIIKRVSAPFAQLLPSSLKQKNIGENINTYTGVQMIPSSFSGVCSEIGVLSLKKNKHDKKLELYFSANAGNEPMWKCALEQFDQLKRPRPNLLCVETYGITTLFKFNDAQQARSLYETVDTLQSTVKVVYKCEIGPHTDFEELNFLSWNPMQAPNPEMKIKATNIAKGKKNIKSKVTKQKSIKNSFKTIISAAKRVKDLDKPKLVMKVSKENDDTTPLLL